MTTNERAQDALCNIIRSIAGQLASLEAFEDFAPAHQDRLIEEVLEMVEAAALEELARARVGAGVEVASLALSPFRKIS